MSLTRVIDFCHLIEQFALPRCSLRLAVSSIFKAVPQLSTVAGLATFMLLVFGIIGEQVFEGAKHYRCVSPDEALPDAHAMRQLKGSNGDSSEIVSFCNPEVVDACDANGTCTYFDGNAGFSRNDYDSVFNAMVGIVQIITFDTWTDQMYELMSATSPTAWIYFFLVMLVVRMHRSCMRARTVAAPKHTHLLRRSWRPIALTNPCVRARVHVPEPMCMSWTCCE